MKRIIICTLLLSVITGCSYSSGGILNLTNSSEIKVPAYSTIDDYVKWAQKNKVNIQLLDSSGNQIDFEESGNLLEIQSQTLVSGETLNIVVCPKGSTCTLIIENDPLKP